MYTIPQPNPYPVDEPVVQDTGEEPFDVDPDRK